MEMIEVKANTVLKALEGAYKVYSEIDNRDRKLRLEGFCNAYEQIIYKYNPQFITDVEELKNKYNLQSSDIDTNYDEPVWTRNLINTQKLRTKIKKK